MAKYNKTMFAILFALLFAFLVLSFSACQIQNNDLKNASKDDNMTNSGNMSSFQKSDGIRKFKSEQELLAYLKERQYNSNNLFDVGYAAYERGDTPSMNNGMKSEEIGASDSMAQSIPSDAGASEYSETNVQEKGVDEADIVKNDGKYIYVLTGKKVSIVDAFPAANASILSEIKLHNNGYELFLKDDKLVVITRFNQIRETVDAYSFVPQKQSFVMTQVLIFDITNRTNPVLENNYTISGNYYDSRMIDDNVYVISKEYMNMYRNNVDMPYLFANGVKTVSPEIYYFDTYNYGYSFNFHTIASFDLNDLKKKPKVKSFMLDSSNNLYVSKNNIYISYAKHERYSFVDGFKNVVYPLLNNETQKEVDNLDFGNNVTYSEKEYLYDISKIMQEMYNKMNETDKTVLVNKIEKDLSEYYEKKEIENQKTIIHKISIKNGDIKYETKGEVNGTLLNEFSLSESEDNLRVATTTKYYSRKDGRKMFNNVYVLDKDLKQIGAIENLAKDEQIRSTRFLGDKLYMVTFKQIDPLFVINLSNSKKPKVLGQLKIPGYSTYLHPYDANHIIGLGYDTKESEWGGIVNNGVKLSLFDISDFEHPKEVAKYIIKGRYTNSLALSEHKSFLFDKKKELLVIPVSKYVGDENKDGYYKRDSYEQGAYVFRITEKGFDLRGIVSHEDNHSYNYWYSPNAVKRSLYMDDVLYTISNNRILMSSLNDLKKLKEIELNKENPIEPYYFYD